MRRIPSEVGAFRAAETGGFVLSVAAAAASHQAAPKPHAVLKNIPASTQGRIDCRRSTTMGAAPVPEAAIRGGTVGVSARWVLARRARRTSSSGATVTRGLPRRAGWNESALMAGVIGLNWSPGRSRGRMNFVCGERDAGFWFCSDPPAWKSCQRYGHPFLPFKPR